MAEPDGPWRQNREPENSGSKGRFFLWLALMAAVGLGLWKLAELFPGRATSEANEPYLLYTLGFLALMSASVIFGRRFRLKESLRNIAIWVGVAVVLMLGYAYQNELKEIGFRLRSELIPGAPQSGEAKEMVLSESQDGHFHVIGQANGTHVDFLIDTGSSDIVLSPADARRMGIDVASLNFTRSYQTANGMGLGAPFKLDSLQIGPIALLDVPASVNEAGMNSSLLGMSFLKQLSSYEVRGRQLFLRWR